MNAIVFYSSTIFTSVNVNPNVGTAAAQTLSMLSCFVCTLMLGCMGRKSLMTLWFFVLAILSALMCFFAVGGKKHSVDGQVPGLWGNGELITVMLFVSIF